MQGRKKGRPLYALLIEHREIPLLAVLVLLLTLVSIRVPGYLGNNYMNILKGGSINMVMAAGMLCVLLVGSIDISVTAILAFAGALCGKLMGMGVIQSTWLMFVLGIGIGAVIGALNGVLMSYGEVIAIIVTLGTSYIVRALIPMEWLLGMNKVVPTDLTQGFKDSMVTNTFLGLPFLVWMAIIVTVWSGSSSSIRARAATSTPSAPTPRRRRCAACPSTASRCWRTSFAAPPPVWRA